MKEASERAILSLRTLQNRYAMAVRWASTDPAIAHPTTAIFRSQDVLRPFLLAANYPDVGYRLLSIAIDAMKRLVEGDAVQPSDGAHVVRVLGIQVNVCAGTLGTAAASAPGAGGGRADRGWERGLPGRAGRFAVSRRRGKWGGGRSRQR